MADGCADTSVASIGNDFFGVSSTSRKVILVVFDDDISKKYIPIGAYVTTIDLPKCTLIDQLNEKQLLHGGSNSLISISQDCELVVAVHDVDNHHGRKQYIHADNRVVSMKFDKALMYSPI